MCSQCSTRHLIAGQTTGHRLTTYCELHANQPRDVKCDKHDMYVCRQCLATGHVYCEPTQFKWKYILLACLPVILACCLNYISVQGLCNNMCECKCFNTTGIRGSISLKPYYEVFKNVQKQDVEIIHTFSGLNEVAIFNDTVYYMLQNKTIQRVSTFQ